jgi:hypothetical protein
VGTSRLARRLTTIRPAMPLAEAVETTRIHSVAGRSGDRTTLVTTRPCRAPHHTISDVSLIGGGHVPMPGEVRGTTTLCASWMSCRSAGVMSWRAGDNRSRRVSYTDNLAGVLDLASLIALATWGQTPTVEQHRTPSR